MCAHGSNRRKKDVGFYRKFLIWRLTGERFESNDPPGQNTKFLTKVLYTLILEGVGKDRTGRGREVGEKHPAEEEEKKEKKKEEEKRRRKRRRGRKIRKRVRKEEGSGCLLCFLVTSLGLDTHNMSVGGGEEGRVIVTMTSVTLQITSPRDWQDMSSPQQALAHLTGKASASSPQHLSPIWSFLAYQHLRSAASPTGRAKTSIPGSLVLRSLWFSCLLALRVC